MFRSISYEVAVQMVFTLFSDRLILVDECSFLVANIISHLRFFFSKLPHHLDLFLHLLIEIKKLLQEGYQIPSYTIGMTFMVTIQEAMAKITRIKTDKTVLTGANACIYYLRPIEWRREDKCQNDMRSA